MTEPVADFVLGESPAVVRRYTEALKAGLLTLESTPARLRREFVLGPKTLERIGAMTSFWRAQDGSAGLLVAMIDGHATVAERVEAAAPLCELVWTGPHPAGSRVRSTLPVIEEMLGSAEISVLVVAYSLWLGGGAAQVITRLATLSSLGVNVTFVVDARYKHGWNMQELSKRWPKGHRRPLLFTWHDDVDQIAKLHAKVLIVDHHDALVTSANLTDHGVGGNLELGFRVRGGPARDVARHFDSLLQKGVFDTVRL